MSAIDSAALKDALVAPNGPYAALDVVASTGSTNADLRKAAASGAADRTVLIAEEQTAGVGRMARAWVSTAGTGVYLSVLLRPAGVAPERIGSLAIVAGLALKDTCDDLDVDATLKWPNDLLAPDGKLAGVLAELEGDGAAVVGIGVNVLPPGEVPPGPGGLPAASLDGRGASTTDRSEIAAALLRHFADHETAWRAAQGDLAKAGLLDGYVAACSTIGTQVTVSMPGGSDISGRAIDIDPAGHLIVESEDGGRQTIFAGDVVHVR